MDILLDCPHCDGRASFRPPRFGSRGGRLIGRCAACRSVFSLFGGRLSDVELGPGLGHLIPSARSALRRQPDHAVATLDAAPPPAPS